MSDIQDKFDELKNLKQERDGLNETIKAKENALAATKNIDWRKAGYKPGQELPTGGWLPWTVEDLDPKDVVEFIPQNIESISAISYPNLPSRSISGKPFLVVDVNGLQALYEVGTKTITNRYFYNAYINALNAALERQNFMDNGPMSTPWKSTWVHLLGVPTFGMDLEGRSLRDKDWYEFNQDGIPVKLSEVKLLAKLYFNGTLELNLTKREFAEVVLTVLTLKLKAKVKNFINKLWRKK